MSKSVRELLKDKDEAAAEAKLQKLVKDLGISEDSQKRFVQLVEEQFFPSKAIGPVNWDDVAPLTDKEQFDYHALPEPTDPKALLNQFVFCKLNGGLGTTMGCTCPKSLVICQEGKTFFDLLVEQVIAMNSKYGSDVPLLLMNSFYTDEAMKPVMAAVKGLKVLAFNQQTMPRIDEETLEPVAKTAKDPISSWYSPGHADVWICLAQSGLLDKFLAEGKKYMMVSNCDNLGAEVDLRILQKLVSENRPYGAEVVMKTPDDWKGGMPIRYKGGIRLLETAQVPRTPVDRMKEFVDVSRFPFFHSNNLWMNLEALKKALETGTLKLDAFLNKKQLNGRGIIQIEAAAGSAIQSWPESIAIKVPRSRFLPVKSCVELVLMRSDFFVKSAGAHFVQNPVRTIVDLPHIEFDPLYASVVATEQRFPHPLGLTKLTSLVLKGDVTFGKGVQLVGDVKFEVPAGEKVVIPDGKTLTNVVIASQAQVNAL